MRTRHPFDLTDVEHRRLLNIKLVCMNSKEAYDDSGLGAGGRPAESMLPMSLPSQSLRADKRVSGTVY